MGNRKSNIYKMLFKASRLLTALIFISVMANTVHSATLTEIMYNPDGNEDTDEFIELYNDESTPFNLYEFLLADGADSDSFVAVGSGLLVQPGQYVLVLDRRYLEDSSTTYFGIVPESALVVTINDAAFGSGGLSNSVEKRISLIYRGASVSSYAYTLNNPDGISDEKVLIDGGDEVTNWRNSARHHGTPGGRNSVTPSDRDLAIESFISLPPTPQYGENFILECVVKNVGLFLYQDHLALFETRFAPVETVLIRQWQTPDLQPDDTVLFQETLVNADESARYFSIRLSGLDDNDGNDEQSLIISANGAGGSIVFNEVLWKAEPQRCEWIELMNGLPFSQSLTNWMISDGTGITDSTRRFRLPGILLNPGAYVVLAADSTIFFEPIPEGVPIVVWEGHPISLNNTGDSLVLWNSNGLQIDRLDYRPSWGGDEAGISIERISISAETNDPLNWASSLDSTGGTPGRQNSRSLPAATCVDNLLVLEPNPFSPDGDGRDDVLAIRYRLDRADSHIELKIFDSRGREVRRIAHNEPAGYSGEKLWDGKDDSGRFLTTGLYIVFLEAMGKGGNRVQTAKRAVVLARPS